MIDFHSHVLPEIDDGSSSVEMSLEMLDESYKQGVRTVIATPHCYLASNSELKEYLELRQEKYNILEEAMKKDGREFPEVKLGCELRFLKEIEDYSALEDLCIEGTNYILIEMPFGKWNMNMYDIIYSVMLKKMRPVMAHIERFWDKRALYGNLYSMDLCYQVNAESIITNPDKKHIEQLFTEGACQVIGSDMHNMTKRPTYMKKAKEAIIRVYGEERFDYLMNNARNILDNKPVIKKAFPKLGFFQKMKL